MALLEEQLRSLSGRLSAVRGVVQEADKVEDQAVKEFVGKVLAAVEGSQAGTDSQNTKDQNGVLFGAGATATGPGLDRSKHFEKQEKTLQEAFLKLETLTSEKIAKEKEVMEMDLELTRLKKKVEKEEKETKKKMERLVARNEELEGVFAENEELQKQLPGLLEDLASTKKSEQALLIQVSHLKEGTVREVADMEKRLGQEITLLKQEISTLESERQADMERARRGEHVEATQRKIETLEKELDRHRQLEQSKFGSQVTERVQLEEKIAELSLLIGTYEEQALQDAETIRDLQERQNEVVAA